MMSLEIWHLGRERAPDEFAGDFYLDRVVASALEPCADYGVAWIYRGLYCGVAARYYNDKNSFLICGLSLNAPSATEYERYRTMHASGRIAGRPARELTRTFPQELIKRVLARMSPGANGVDEVPMCLHMINDRNTRRVAVDSYRSNQL